jgi:hypothetical protein
MPDYFARIHLSGAVGCDRLPRKIGVTASLHDPAPIGVASRIGRTEEGLAVWRLRVRGADLPGRWVILGKWFLADEG